MTFARYQPENRCFSRVSILILFISYFYNFSFARINVLFDRVLHKQGFSHRIINCFAQDRKGFIWFGTNDGLYRFDGYHCATFRYDSTDPGSISDSRINSLCVDSRGILWIGTDKGLNSFNHTTETFTRYLHRKNDLHSLSNNEVKVLYNDKKGFLWIGTVDGLNRLEIETGKIKRFMGGGKTNHSLSHKYINCICEDSTGELWIGTAKGLNRLQPGLETFTHYFNRPGDSRTLSHNDIMAVYEDSNKELWIGTWEGGLNKYNRQEDRFTHPYSGPGISCSNLRIKTIYEDRSGTLWIGTRGSGLCRILDKKGQFEFYRNDPNNPRSLSSNKVNAIFEDRTGILWIGTIGAGINTYKKGRERFCYFNHNPGVPNSLSDNTVLSIYEDPEKAGEVLWIGTYSGLNRFERKNNEFTHYLHNPQDPNSISSNVVRYIYKDSKNNFWLGTDDGLNQFDRENGTFTAFKHERNNPNSLSDKLVGTIYEDRGGRLWVGTDGGLNLFNHKEKSFKHFIHDPDNPRSISSDIILCIHEQSQSNESVLWIGTYNGGLNKFNREENKFTHYRSHVYKPGALSNDNIRVIFEDKKGILWLGTDGGLNRFDPETGKILVYTEKNGLPSNKVYGILKDDDNNLWLSTLQGLSRFDRVTETFKDFGKDYALQNMTFTQDAFYKSKVTGEMFFGGVNGFVSFFPRSIKENKEIPPIVITDFKLFNKSVGIGGKLKKSIFETDEIHLTHNDNQFSLEFAALDYTFPHQNQYSYRMDGVDKDWIPTDAQNRIARYSNLKPGSYHFKVRGSNNDGTWNKEGASIKIIIIPPFWQTWWFQLGVVLGLILLLSLGYYGYRNKLLKEKLEEQQRVQRVLKQARDLAEFRLAEIEKLITAISSLLIAVDSKGEIFQWNETAKNFFNMTDSKSIGQSFAEVLKDYIDPDLLTQMMKKGLGEDNDYNNFEIPIHFKNKSTKLLLGVISPIMDKAGQKRGFLLLAEDITHRKEEEFRRNLSQKLESLGIMASNIAHEVKTPLQYIGHNGTFISESFTSIVKYVNLLNQCLPELEKSGQIRVIENIKNISEEYDIPYLIKEIPNASDHIVQGVTRLSTIIQSMKEYSHPGRGTKEYADINQLLESTLVLIRNKKKNILDIETELFESLPQVPCYSGELCQVFMNLSINAADAIQEKKEAQGEKFQGLIKIRTSVKDNEVIVAIADNGCGMPEYIRENIYNPFFTTKEVGKGTGQGLAAVHSIIIERHKGKLYFESAVGEGTSFYIHLPIKIDD